MTAYTSEVGVDPRSYPAREERREAALRGWFTRPGDEAMWDFVITNLSYGGCQLRTGADVAIGETLRLSVNRRGVILATVKWRKGEHVGLAFDAPAPPRPHWPRRVERHKAALNVLVRRQGRKSQHIDATDVSQHGCCLEFVDAPREGDRLWVQLPCLEAIETEVRWVENYKAGVVFTKPIHPSVFELLLDAWRIKNG